MVVQTNENTNITNINLNNAFSVSNSDDFDEISYESSNDEGSIDSSDYPSSPKRPRFVGDLEYEGTLVGWGRDGWGEQSWGEANSVVLTLTGQSFTSSVGSTTVADMAVGLTGQSFTSSVGSLSPADVVGLTGPSFSPSSGAPPPRRKTPCILSSCARCRPFLLCFFGLICVQ